MSCPPLSPAVVAPETVAPLIFPPVCVSVVPTITVPAPEMAPAERFTELVTVS